MNLSEQHRNRLEQLLHDHQCMHVLPYLLEKTRNVIRGVKAEKANYHIPCTSRVGGDPDLPPHLDWPLTTDGVPMTFLLQLNLKDMAIHDESRLLPASGMLYFFVGIDEPAYHIQHRVLYLQDEQLATAKHRLSPEETALEERFCGYQLDARGSLEPPNYAYVDDDLIENETFGYEDYEDLCFEISESQTGDVVKLFGYPEGQHGDAEIEAALMMLTGANYNYKAKEALQKITNHFAGDEEKAKQEIQDTLMLLELDSDDDIGFCWWDAGVLHFFIRKEDLLAGRFDRTYCSLYSS
ncbi:YwqG family protein [Paenibacillus sp. UMB4589-SE434]|uniref:YwqG family protein n=1 Tax=Paenibacillus sp. UMB4589-SE434 TaxID=3046314 RepID=UPI00254C3DD4|nr:YwqG family protein [Paenibacillus sp. UMB4589-SE434]MDK8182382.1 YwqG family protein [Paenibacillus sp. UMB4589-SE434]